MAASTLLLLLSSMMMTGMATHVEQEWKVELKAEISGPSEDQVWPLVADFCNLYLIFPTDISFCVDGVNAQPGQLRFSASKPTDNTTSVVLWAKEELLVFNSQERFITYEIQENNRGVTKFTGTMQILPAEADDKDGCIFKWSIKSAPFGGFTYEAYVEFIKGILSDTIDMIESLF